MKSSQYDVHYTVSAVIWTGTNKDEFVRFAESVDVIAQFDKDTVMIIYRDGTKWISPNWYLVVFESSGDKHFEIISKEEFEDSYELDYTEYSEPLSSKFLDVIYLKQIIESYFPKKDV